MALVIGASGTAFAQTTSPAPSALPTLSSDPAALLSENLKALARDPYNVDALVQAGELGGHDGVAHVVMRSLYASIQVVVKEG